MTTEINAAPGTLRQVFSGVLTSPMLYIEGYINRHDEKSRLVVDTSVNYMDIVNASLEILIDLDLEKIAEKHNDTGHRHVLSAEIMRRAKAQIKASLENTVANGAGNNENYVHSAAKRVDGVPTYEYVTKGVKLHTATGNLHISGLLLSKQVIEPGEYPVVNSRILTVAKMAIENELPRSKFREYKLGPGKFESIMSNGENIEEGMFF